MIQNLYDYFPFLLKTQESNKSFSISKLNCQSLSFGFVFTLGLAMILSAVIFFFAFNWQAMPDFFKFAILQALICISTFCAYKFSLDTILGKLFLTLSSVLVGVFMAVFGQVYQTGADSYLLFLVWAVAILPFTLISKFSILWTIWILLINLTIILAWGEQFRRFYDDEHLLHTSLLLFNAFVLFAREILVNKFLWLNSYLSRLLPFLLVQIFLAREIIISILDNSSILHTGFALLLSFFIFFVYRFKLKDITLVSLNLITNCCLLVIFIASQIKFELSSYIILSVFVIFVLAMLGKYIELLYRKFNVEKITNGKSIEQELIEKSTKVGVEDKQTSAKDSRFSYIRAGLCFVSACVTVVVVMSVFFLLYSENFEGSDFFLIAGVIFVFCSLWIYKLQREELNSGKNSYILFYLGLSTVMQAYALICSYLVFEQDFSSMVIALIFTGLSIAIYPFISSNLEKFIIALLSMLLLYRGFIDFYFYVLGLDIILLCTMSFGYKFANKYQGLKVLAYASFIALILKVVFMLSDNYFFIFPILYSYSFGILLALWICILYCLYSMKLEKARRRLSITSVFAHIFAFACLGFLVYFYAYALLLITGVMLLAIYFEKILLLRAMICFSIPIIFYYYYNLDINLLHKSYLLFANGSILLVFCAYKREGLKDAK